MKSKKYILNTLMIFLFISALIIAGCSTSSQISEKSGAQLWGENCIRCHNAPTPSAFSDTEWETIAQHMRVRANLNSDQIKKIVEFFKMAN